jgi:hypothetical protein
MRDAQNDAEVSHKTLTSIVLVSGRRGSNSRHSAWEADTLPTELRPQITYFNEQFLKMPVFLPAVFRALCVRYLFGGLAGYRCLPRCFRVFYVPPFCGGIIGELLLQNAPN